MHYANILSFKFLNKNPSPCSCIKVLTFLLVIFFFLMNILVSVWILISNKSEVYS